MEGTTCEYSASAPMFSNRDIEGPCKATFEGRSTSALITVGCLPPVEVGYFGYQTNIFARRSPEDNTVYFPEVSPLPTINHATVGSRWGEPFVIVTTGSQDVADKAKETLVAAGVDESIIIYDGLANSDLVLDGPTPDVLEVVVRLNNNNFSELNDYIDASSTEQLALYLDPIDPPPSFTPLQASPLRTRKKDPSPSDPDYASDLDSLTSMIEEKMSSKGYVLSYAGKMEAAMDYGYTETDTDECCISGYLDEIGKGSNFWEGNLVHFSTNDCLYRVHGAYSDPLGNWNSGEVGLVGSPIAIDYDAIGEEAEIVTYSSFTCDGGDDISVLYYCETGECNEEECEKLPLSSIPQLSGCNPLPSNPHLHYLFACVDSSPVMETYVDSSCSDFKISTSDVNECRNSTSSYEGPVWAGGIARDSTVSFVLGVRTNGEGRSSFHNVYLPDFTNYGGDGGDLSFGEDGMVGSAESWGWGGGDHLFAVEFSRKCMGDGVYCKEIDWTTKPTGEALVFMSRQYLDPVTNTGPDKDSVEGHRVLIFDPVV